MKATVFGPYSPLLLEGQWKVGIGKRWEGIPEAMDCCVLIGRRDRQWKQQSPDTAHKGGETSSRKLFRKLRKSPHKRIFCPILFP